MTYDAVTGFKVSHLYLTVGETETINLEPQYADGATNLEPYTVAYYSLSSTVATVDSDGVVTALSASSEAITIALVITTASGSTTYLNCLVYVSAAD